MRKAQGVEIIAADNPGAFVEDTRTATLQVLGAVAQCDKATTVANLHIARDCNRDGDCEGVKSHAEQRAEVSLWTSDCTSRRSPAPLARSGTFSPSERGFQ